MSTLPIAWTKHLANEPEAKKQLEDTIRNSTTVLSRLLDILKDKRTALNQVETKLESYDNPSWAHKQAFLNGKRAEVEEVINLLTFLEG